MKAGNDKNRNKLKIKRENISDTKRWFFENVYKII